MRTLVELPTALTILIVTGFILRLRYPRAGAWVAAAGLMSLYAVATPLVGSELLQTLSGAATRSGCDTGASKPEAIVVLAAGIRYAADGKPEAGALTMQRLQAGARLLRKTNLPLLVSGGPVRNAPELILSRIMQRTLAEDFGIGDVWSEQRSRTTAENAVFSTKLLRQKGISCVYLVTNAWHMPRAKMAFAATGMSVIPEPADGAATQKKLRLNDFLPTASGLQQSQHAFHEWIGRIWYAMFLPAPQSTS